MSKKISTINGNEFEDDIANQTFWRDLSETTKYQAAEVIMLYKDYLYTRITCILAGISSTIASGYFFLFKMKSSKLAYTYSLNETSFNKGLFIITFLFILTIITRIISEKKKAFNDFRLSFIKLTPKKFCYHTNSCECGQDFIIYMSKCRNINLMF